MTSFKLNIQNAFKEYVDSALVRFNYLYPEVNVNREEETLMFSFDQDEGDIEIDLIKKEFNYLLYREKIYKDTLPVKRWLFSSPSPKDED
jgi:hypothetical protein